VLLASFFAGAVVGVVTIVSFLSFRQELNKPAAIRAVIAQSNAFFIGNPSNHARTSRISASNYPAGAVHSPAAQIISGEHKPLDSLPGGEVIHDFRHIAKSDPPIKEMIRLNQNTDAA
jgi:hypothetical protein